MTQTGPAARPTRMPAATIVAALLLFVASAMAGLDALGILADVETFAWTLFTTVATPLRAAWTFLVECAAYPARLIGA